MQASAMAASFSTVLAPLTAQPQTLTALAPQRMPIVLTSSATK